MKNDGAQGMDDRQKCGFDFQAALERLGGNTELLKKVLRSFYGQFKDAMHHIRRCLENGEAATALKMIHAIKGCAGNIGAKRLFEAAGDLEANLRSGTPDRLKPALDAFSASHEQVIQAIEELEPETDNGPFDPAASLSLDTSSLARVIRTMRAWLENSDSRVRHALTELRMLLKGNLKKQFEMLDKAVFELDPEKALGLLSEIAENLQLDLKQDGDQSDDSQRKNTDC